MASSTLVMYLLLREDLIAKLKWPLGAVFTQIAHASTACIWTYREDPKVVAYMKDIDNMHKVRRESTTLLPTAQQAKTSSSPATHFQVTLKVPDEDTLRAQAEKLTRAQVDHRVWIEDGMAVCIAVKPEERSRLKPLLGDLPLYK